MTTNQDKKSIVIVAGEASGDLLGGYMLSALRPQLPDTLIHGIGGSKMAEHGFISDWPIEKLSVNGLFEILVHFHELKQIRDTLLKKTLEEKPAVFIGIDAPEFNLGLELKLRQAGIPTIHFVSPSVWAWRKRRIKKIARAVSRMLVLFPFEEEIYRQAGIPVTYVGHPLAAAIPMQPDVSAARAALGLPEAAKIVAILPGSRMSEIKFHTAAFIGAARILAKREPDIQFVVPLAGGEKQKQYFQELIAKAGLQDVPLIMVDGQSHRVMTAADVVLVASGTATLEVALHKKPMVIAYKMMRATWEIARRIVSPPIGLPNILAREMIVPEILQNDATPEVLAEHVWKPLNDPVYCRELYSKFTEIHQMLLRNAAEESARAVLEVMGQTA